MERSQGGLGIGLSLVQALVGLHGGSVTAESAGTGKGSVFTVRLPLVAAVADADAAAVPRPNTPVSHSFRVLVVDDNRDAADSLAMILELNGHKIRVANDGEQALGLAGEFRPQVVFLDIGMPGKNGYDVARELRRSQTASQAVLVALTGWGAEDDRARSRDAGFDHHLTKPAEMAAVERLLAQLPRPPA
jgi:CheY-like chemotaxis protein